MDKYVRSQADTIHWTGRRYVTLMIVRAKHLIASALLVSLAACGAQPSPSSSTTTTTTETTTATETATATVTAPNDDAVALTRCQGEALEELDKAYGQMLDAADYYLSAGYANDSATSAHLYNNGTSSASAAGASRERAKAAITNCNG